MAFLITITGQVQGVGFRPFVYRLATEMGLLGHVGNSEKGVSITIGGSKKTAKNFHDRVLLEKPTNAVISSSSFRKIKGQDYPDFKIQPSQNDVAIQTPLTPDFSICEACKAEISDANNRRFEYAFTTCVNCGPRYAITKNYPFERANTSLDSFEMCAACRAEYVNPNNRRFHSQTNSCVDCGINLTLENGSGHPLKLDQKEILSEIAKQIVDGKIIAIKNTSGYLLCCDSWNGETIKRLRRQKGRPSKPFALLYPSFERVEEDFSLSHNERKALQSQVAPIVILNYRKGKTDLAVAEIAPNLDQLGVMLPASALLVLLMSKLDFPIIATSGNIHGSPIIADRAMAKKELNGVTDFFLHNDLEIRFPQDDSVMRFAENQRIVLRRSRGLAPGISRIELSYSDPVLAMGADLKSAFCIMPNKQVYASPYFGNLENYDVQLRFLQTLETYQRLFGARPEKVIIDQHPQFHSSRMGSEIAERHGAELISLQHHKAHFYSILGEHDLLDSCEKIMGLVWDGAGYGEDGNIWGGEFFTFHEKKMMRSAYFEYFDWILGNKMSMEPRLALLSLLKEETQESIFHKFTEVEWDICRKALEKNTLKTSSLGRIFDAIASLLDLCDKNTFEGEAAMILENAAAKYVGEKPLNFLEGHESQNIPAKLILTEVFKAKKSGVAIPRLAYSFIYTLAITAIKIAKRENCGTVCCSGGVFQNSLLVSLLIDLGKENNLTFKFHDQLSPNDENIAFGQLIFAAIHQAPKIKH